MAVTQEQVERIAILGAIRTARQKGRDAIRHDTTQRAFTITNSRILEELDHRAEQQHNGFKWVIEHTLWEALFPGEPWATEQTVKLVKTCPACGSRHILEPKNGFPLKCECFDCHAEFDEPLWGELND